MSRRRARVAFKEIVSRQWQHTVISILSYGKGSMMWWTSMGRRWHPNNCSLSLDRMPTSSRTTACCILRRMGKIPWRTWAHQRTSPKSYAARCHGLTVTVASVGPAVGHNVTCMLAGIGMRVYRNARVTNAPRTTCASSAQPGAHWAWHIEGGPSRVSLFPSTKHTCTG